MEWSRILKDNIFRKGQNRPCLQLPSSRRFSWTTSRRRRRRVGARLGDLGLELKVNLPNASQTKMNPLPWPGISNAQGGAAGDQQS